MPNPTDMIAAANAAIATSDALVAASQALIDNAHVQMNASPPTLTLDEYRELVLHHAAVVGHAATIRSTTAIDLGSQIKASTGALLAVTAKLNDAMASLATIQNVIDKAAKVLVAVGSVATLVASPTLMTIGAVVSAVTAVVEP